MSSETLPVIDEHELQPVTSCIAGMTPDEAEAIVLAFTDRLMKTFDRPQVHPLQITDAATVKA